MSGSECTENYNKCQKDIAELLAFGPIAWLVFYHKGYFFLKVEERPLNKEGTSLLSKMPSFLVDS